MPLQKLVFRPGVNKENTNYANEGGWYSCDKVRFRSGFPEKIGGWTRFSNDQFLGVCRSITNWTLLDGTSLLGVGTNSKMYLNKGGAYFDITPLYDTTVNASTATSGPFFASNGSNAVTVVDATYNPEAGDYVIFSGAANLYNSSGNVSATVLNTEYQVSSVVNSTAYTVIIPVSANANDTLHGGNVTTITYLLPSGNDIYTIGTGWGAGPWPSPTIISLTDPFTTNAASGTVLVTDTAHGLTTGDSVRFANATAVGGVAAVLLNSDYSITTANANAYTFSLGVNGYGAAITATSTATGGGSVTAYYPNGTRGWGTGYTTGIGSQLRLWTQDNFGEDFIFAPRGGELYYWDATTGVNVRAVTLESAANAAAFSGQFVPNTTNQIISSAVQRFVICFGANPYDPAEPNTAFDPLLIRWSDQENPFDWVPSATNQSGEQRLTIGSSIIQAVNTRQEIVVFTDAAVYSMQYLGPPYVFGFQLLQDNISIMSPRSAITINNVTYWMGSDKFFSYSGRVETLPSSLRTFVFQNLNRDQSWQIFAASNEQYSEVWWFYPSTGSTIVDSYVVYNYLDRVWYYGTMGRTAWLDSGTLSYPVAADYNRRLLNHENGVDDSSGPGAVAISAYIDSSDFDIGDGHNFGFVWRILPDITFSGSSAANPSCTMVVQPRTNSGSAYGAPNAPTVTRTQAYPVELYTGQVYTRIRGRQMAFRIESSALGTTWQLGAPRIDIRPDGRR
jgi:hypothetical protein